MILIIAKLPDQAGPSTRTKRKAVSSSSSSSTKEGGKKSSGYGYSAVHNSKRKKKQQKKKIQQQEPESLLSSGESSTVSTITHLAQDSVTIIGIPLPPTPSSNQLSLVQPVPLHLDKQSHSATPEDLYNSMLGMLVNMVRVPLH